MRANEEDLLAGALALAFKYADVAALRRAFASAEASDGPGVVKALDQQKLLTPRRADRLTRATALVGALRADAAYGTIAMRNRIVGAQMLNACMEETRKAAYARALPAVLLERGVVTEAHDVAIRARQAEVLDELTAKVRALAATIDLRKDPVEQAELKLAMLLGEVAAQLSFLARADLEAALSAQERVAQGLPADVPHVPPPSKADQAAQVDLPVPAPGAAAADESQDPIKGYELLLKLGAGAMGAVLKARKRDTGEVVALKILKPDLSGDREFVERFLREAKAVARLSHPNVIRAVQAGRSGDYYFFAMEFIEGQTVADLIKAKGRLPERFAIMVARCIASALAHAWQHQIIHRDIKPDNIMVTKDGAVKLTDLGLARTAKQESTLTMTGVVMGSPAYISPEQATGEKNLDARSDIYSLGATLFHMLTGKVPYEGETPLHVMLKHMNDPLPDAKAHAPQTSEATRAIIFKMMAKRPEQRYQSARDVEVSAKVIEDALGRGETPLLPGMPGAPSTPVTAAALAASGVRKAPAVASVAAPAAPAARPAPKGKGKLGSSIEGKKAKDPEIGERLKRIAKKKRGGRV